MSTTQRTTLNARKSRVATSSHQTAQQPFPFSQLPRELRHEIYLLCLASKSPTRIVVDESLLIEERLIGERRLKLHWDSWRDRNFTLDTGLLHLNRSIHDEAISVLYGHNSFQFLGIGGWRLFYWFHGSLTESNRQHLRHLELSFPSFEIGYIRRSEEGYRDAGIESLKDLQRLKTLTLHVLDGITSSDTVVLQKIHENCPHGCQITLVIPKVMDRGAILISPGALKKTQEWNWNIDRSRETLLK